MLSIGLDTDLHSVPIFMVEAHSFAIPPWLCCGVCSSIFHPLKEHGDQVLNMRQYNLA